MIKLNALSKNKIIEYITLVSLAAYLFYQCMLNTAMPISLTSSQYNLFVVVFSLLSCIKTIKCIKNKDYKNLILFFVAFFVSLLSYIYGTYKFLLTLSLMMISVYEIEYRKIFRIYLIISGLVLLICLFSSFTEIAPNYVNLRKQTGSIRSGWGICFCTELAAVFSYFSIYLFGYNEKYSNWLLLIPSSIAFFIAKFIADSRASTITVSIFFVLIILYCFYKKYENKIKIPKILTYMFFLNAFLVFAIIVFICLLLYYLGNPAAVELNSLLSTRLHLSCLGITNYGIHPFGSYFELYGEGSLESYNFIDISYALILIRYGWIYFAMVALLWMYTAWKALSIKNYKIVIVLLIIAINCMIEQHMNEINYNILFIMPFANFDDRTINVSYENTRLETFILFFVSIFAIGTFILICPVFLSYARTFVEINNLSGIYQNYLVEVIGLITLIILIVCLFIKSIKDIFLNAIKHNKPNIIGFIPMFLMVILCFAFVSNKDCIYNDAYYSYLPIIESESQIIDTISENMDGHIYATVVPEYYKKHFQQISYSIYYGEDLARKKDATLIADINKTYKAFICNNFKKMKISDYHVIYTNDNSVISALLEEGYTFE